MQTLLLPAETFPEADASSQIEAILLFWNALGQRGVPQAFLPPDCQALEDLNDWVGEVLNGGNSQFIGNHGAHAAPMLGRIEALLLRHGLDTQARIAAGVREWIEANPTLASGQTGFNGGRAARLDEWDRAFNAAGNARGLFEPLARSLSESFDLRLHPAEQREKALDDEAQRLMADSQAQRAVAISVAQECRAWLTDPKSMSIALLTGKMNPGRIHLLANWSETLDCQGRKVSEIHGFVTREFGRGHFCTTGRIVLGPDGARFHPRGAPFAVGKDKSAEVPPEIANLDLAVTQAEIRRAMHMALAFRLPESVGLRWSRMARPFRIDQSYFAVMPGARWRPEKWRILWLGGSHWGVKGSPNRSTFMWNKGQEMHETLTQAEITKRLAALGIGAGG